MKYAREVIELMGAYPGRQFKMAELVNYVSGRHPSKREKNAVRQATLRVLRTLQDSGTVLAHKPESARGGSVLYEWKLTDAGAALMRQRGWL